MMIVYKIITKLVEPIVLSMYLLTYLLLFDDTLTNAIYADQVCGMCLEKQQFNICLMFRC